MRNHTLTSATIVAALVAACTEPAETSPPVSTHVEDWRDEVVYEVVVDRFADGDTARDRALGVVSTDGDLARWQGGDWRGLRARLDALADLGVTTLWISPITAGVERGADQDGYHGYWPRDFTTLEPHFGDEVELRALVDDAHERGLKVIVDVVINHTGPVFAYDLDRDGAIDADEHEPPFAVEAYAAPLLWQTARPRVWSDRGAAGAVEVELGDDAFHRRGRTANFGAPVERELGDFPTGLRDLATESPALVADLVTTWREWVVRLDLDGMRLDAVPHVAPAEWRDFAVGLRAALAEHGKHRFLLVGEVWNGDPAVLASYTSAGGLDAVFDFSFKWGLIDAFMLDGRPASDVVPVITSHRDAYPREAHPGGVELDPWQARIAFADNHDTGRLRSEIDDPWVAELAMTAVFTVDAIPCVYYGTEAELSGARGHASREPLWQVDGGDETRMAHHLARLAALRRAHPALRRGTLIVRYASTISARERAPGAGLLVWERAHGDDRVLVALGGHPLDRGVAVVPTGFAPGTTLRDALGVAADVTVGVDGQIVVDIGPREAAIYEAHHASGHARACAGCRADIVSANRSRRQPQSAHR